jgi:hypothetical protein
MGNGPPSRNYSDDYLSFSIQLNDKIEGNNLFVVGKTNPFTNFSIYDKRYNYYYISKYNGNVTITAKKQVDVYYTLIGSGSDIVDNKGNIIDSNSPSNSNSNYLCDYACGSSGEAYPLNPAKITLYTSHVLQFTGLSNITLNDNREPGTTNLSLTDKNSRPLYLDNINTNNPFSVKNAQKVKKRNNVNIIEKNNVDQCFGEYLNSSDPTDKTIIRSGYQAIKFIDTSTYFHSGGKYKCGSQYIPSNGLSNGLLLIVNTK